MSNYNVPPFNIQPIFNIGRASSSAAFSSGQYSILANIPAPRPKIANIAKYLNPRGQSARFRARAQVLCRRGGISNSSQFGQMAFDQKRLVYSSSPASQGGGGGKDTLFDHYHHHHRHHHHRHHRHHCHHHHHHRHRHHAQVKGVVEEKIGKPPTHPFPSSL